MLILLVFIVTVGIKHLTFLSFHLLTLTPHTQIKNLIALVKNNFPISHNFSINKIELHRAMVSLILQIKKMHITGDKHCINKKKNQTIG